MLKIWGLHGLICVVGAGCSRMHKGSAVGKYELWNGGMAVASRYTGEKTPDVIFPEKVVFDDDALRPFVERLLRGESIVVQMGTGDSLCILEWNIIKSA